MKLQLLIASALATTQMFSPVALAKETVRVAPSMIDCPKGLLEDSKLMDEQQQSITVMEVDGEIVNVSVFNVPGTSATCAALTKPELLALSPAEHAALIDLSRRSTSDVLMGDASPNNESLVANDKTLQCSKLTTVATVYPGRCGTSTTPIGSAYFMSSHLAMSAGLVIPSNNEVCLVVTNEYSILNPIYYDVHSVRRSGSLQGQIAGLSLMRSGPVSAGFQVITGNLTSSNGDAITLQVDGTKAGNVLPICQRGPTNSYSTTFAQFLGSFSSGTLWPAVGLYAGGAGWKVDQAWAPMGIHTITIQQTQPPDVFGYVKTDLYPKIRRNLSTDLPTVNNWAATAAPAAEFAINITHPVDNTLVDSGVPINIAVNAGSLYSLQLDGQPTSSTIHSIADGWHTLVAFNPSSPQYRHTLRFETRQLTIPADAFEVDDTRPAYKPLYEGTPQAHNFHKSMDPDWTAFAVVGGIRSTVKLVGSNAFQSQLKLYRQLNYPSGAITLVATSAVAANQIQVSNDSTQGTVYYVEAKPTSTIAHGTGSNYTLSVTTAWLTPAADSFEYDDTRDSYKALYEGTPQTHTFHNANDQDWVAFAVGPDRTSRVEMTGVPAAAAHLEMFRHVNYPDGPVESVAVSSLAAMLTVQHSATPGDPYTVYYVRAKPNAGNSAAVRSNYSLSVTTW